MFSKLGSKALLKKKKNKIKFKKIKKNHQCSLSSFTTISTTHLAQGPLKTHNIKHRYCIYTHNKNLRNKGNTDHCCAVCCAVTLSTCSSYITFHLLSV